MIKSRQRRIRPMALGPAQEPIEKNLNVRPEATWLEPIPIQLVAPDPDPADVEIEKESIRLAMVAAMQHLPANQRAVLILREVLSLADFEVAAILYRSVQSV